MIWPLLFAIGLAQGIFLTGVFILRKNADRLVARLVVALLVAFTLSNYDDLLLSTRWYAALPWTFGTSLAVFFTYGPLFYLYVRTTTEPDINWNSAHWLHFLPFIACFLLYFPVLIMPADLKVAMLDAFLAGAYPVQAFDIALAGLKTAQLGIYGVLAFFQLKKVRKQQNNPVLQLPLQHRARWLARFLFLFALIFLAMLALAVVMAQKGVFIQAAGFGFTLFSCAIMYAIGFTLALRPELVTPGFAEKYATARLRPDAEEQLLAALKYRLEIEKIFTDPELSLDSLAGQLQVAPHRLSMLINARFGKSFSELISAYRVDEFLRRLNDPKYTHLTLFGLALEVGFNSKSAFNAAFKKVTGKTPSEFRR